MRGVQNRLKFWKDSKYRKLNPELLSKEELISIYRENKQSLLSKQHDLEVIINNLLYKDIELTKYIILDLINTNESNTLDLHELINITTCCYATNIEMDNIFSNNKIFDWYFGEYSNNWRYVRYKHLINDTEFGYRKIIFANMIDILNKFIELKDDDKFYRALKIFLYLKSNDEKEAFFNEFAESANQACTKKQSEILSSFSAGLDNETSVKTMLGIDNNSIDDLICRVRELNYNLDKHYNELDAILFKIRRIDKKIFVNILIEIIENKKTSDYFMRQYFRLMNDMQEIILENKNLRYSLSTNYAFYLDYIPMIRTKKIDKIVNDVCNIIKEMIVNNCKKNLFRPVEFFSDIMMKHLNKYNKLIQNTVMDIMYEMIYSQRNIINLDDSEKEILKVLYFYYRDIYNYKCQTDLNNSNIEIYDVIEEIYKKYYNISCNKDKYQIYESANYKLSIDTLLGYIIELICYKNPIKALAVILESPDDQDNERKKDLLTSYFQHLINKKTNEFEIVVSYVVQNGLIDIIAGCCNVDEITRCSLDDTPIKEVQFLNIDYIYLFREMLSSYVKKNREDSINSFVIEFFKKMYEKIIIIQYGDIVFDKYIKDKNLGWLFDDIDTDALMNQIKINLAKLNKGDE